MVRPVVLPMMATMEHDDLELHKQGKLHHQPKKAQDAKVHAAAREDNIVELSMPAELPFPLAPPISQALIAHTPTESDQRYPSFVSTTAACQSQCPRTASFNSAANSSVSSGPHSPSMCLSVDGRRYRHDPYAASVLLDQPHPAPFDLGQGVSWADTVEAEEAERHTDESDVNSQCSTTAASLILDPTATYLVLVRFPRTQCHYIATSAELIAQLQLHRYVVVEADRGCDVGRIERLERLEQHEDPSDVNALVAARGAVYADSSAAFVPDASVESKHHVHTVVEPTTKKDRRVVRIADVSDLEHLRELREYEGSEGVAFARRCVSQCRLDDSMRVEDVSIQFDGEKVTVYFEPLVQKGIDFRNLQRNLYHGFRCRVWLQQTVFF